MYHVDCEATTLSPLLDISIKLYHYFLLNSSPVTSNILIYDINAAALKGWYLLAFASSLEVFISLGGCSSISQRNSSG